METGGQRNLAICLYMAMASSSVMKRETVVISGRVDREVAERFRKAVGRTYGVGYGVLGRALEEALLLWLEKHKEVEG